MTVLKILTWPHPSLDLVADEITYDEISKYASVIDDMFETLEKSENGIGLAATQVGIHKRLFILKTDTAKMVFINPKILSDDATHPESVTGEIQPKPQLINMVEGCLSFPNVFEKVIRPESVIVEALDRSGDQFRIKLTGIEARCFLHELDHLNGVVLIDRISQLKRHRLITKMRKKKHENDAR